MKKFLPGVLAILFAICYLHSAEDPKLKYDFVKEGGFRKNAIYRSYSKRLLHGNQSMKVWLSNEMVLGVQAAPNFRLIGLDYPVGSNNEHLYGGGPFIGGLVNGEPRVSAAYWEGTQEFDPEIKDTSRDRLWMATATTDTTLNPNTFGYYKRQMGLRGIDDDHDGKIDEDELDGLDNDGDWNPLTDDVGADGIPDSLETGCQGSYDPVRNPDPAYDNYFRSRTDICHSDANGINPRMDNRNLYTEKNGLPDHGEPHVDEDYAAISDHDVYFSATDTFTVPAIGSLKPLGIKIWAKSYAFEDAEYQPFIPFDYYFINVGKNVIDNVYLGWDADMDLGPLSDANYVIHDYAAYDAPTHTAYVHNPLDRGSTPLGLTVLGASRPLDSLNFMFHYWAGGTTPQTDKDQYDWITCTTFGTSGCIEADQPQTTLDDMRLIISLGPFGTMNPGDTLKLSVGLVSGSGIYEAPSPMLTAKNSDGSDGATGNANKLLAFYKLGYRRPVVPPSPCLSVEQGFKKATLRWDRNVSCSDKSHVDPALTWDDDSEVAESYPDTSWRRINPPPGHTRGGRIFEGYRLYRSEDPAGAPSSFTLLKQFDIKDDFSFNTGLDTMFVDSNLVRGKRYWYAVTSFGLPHRVISTSQVSPGVFRTDTIYTSSPESPLAKNATSIDVSFSPSQHAGEVLAVPNPYRVDQDYTFESGGWEGRARKWTENDRLLKFIHLPKKCTIRIFTMTGDQVTTLQHDDPVNGEVSWNILSESNRALASGIYIFSVESEFGKQVGKFVLIR